MDMCSGSAGGGGGQRGQPATTIPDLLHAFMQRNHWVIFLCATVLSDAMEQQVQSAFERDDWSLSFFGRLSVHS